VSSENLGFFFLDMFPREGKFGHAAAFSFQNPCNLKKITGEEKRQPVIMTMACNFPDSGCISFSDVVTFFHEFGHIMHQMCSRPEIQDFCGFGVEFDFVEAPSQMLENWCYEEKPLEMMSCHIKTGTSIPSELIERLQQSKRVLSGLANKRQFVFGLFDLAVYSICDPDADFDPRQLWADIVKRVCEYDLPDDVHKYANFAHIIDGYDAGYYGYKRAETYSSNMFHAVFKENPLSREAGLRYRKTLLEPGSTKDGLELLKDFLGCEPSDEYFLRDQGLQTN
jgi:Zn-dependent oligopeptidase